MTDHQQDQEQEYPLLTEKLAAELIEQGMIDVIGELRRMTTTWKDGAAAQELKEAVRSLEFTFLRASVKQERRLKSLKSHGIG